MVLYLDVTQQALEHAVFAKKVPSSFNVRVFQMLMYGYNFPTFYFAVDAEPVLALTQLPNQNDELQPIDLGESLTRFFANEPEISETQRQTIDDLPDEERKLVWQAVELFTKTDLYLADEGNIYIHFTKSRTKGKNGWAHFYDPSIIDTFIAVMTETHDFAAASNASFYKQNEVTESLPSFREHVKSGTPFTWMKELYGVSPDTRFDDVEGKWSSKFRAFLRTGETIIDI